VLKEVSVKLAHVTNLNKTSWKKSNEISGSHGGECENYSLLE
jgi:hypothetical protein